MFSVVVIVFLLMLLLSSVIRLLYLKREEHKRVQQGILLTVHLKRIIDSCQKHRGTSNMVNQRENIQDMNQLVHLQDDIDSLISSHDSELLQRFPQWESFTDHWSRLKKHAVEGDLTSHNLVRQHSLMIDGHLSLLDAVMHDHDLHQMMVDKHTPVSEICLNTLRVAETVGQTRAVGSGICARGQCLGTDKIILDFLRLSVQSATEELLKKINTINNDELYASLDKAAVSISVCSSKLITMIDSIVQKESRVKVDANDYFNTSTKAIDEVLKVFGIIIHYASKQHIRMI